MMDSYSLTYLIGNLLGRLIMSFLIVWVIFILFNKFNWSLALKKTRSWYGIIFIGILFVLGVASQAIKNDLV